VLFGHRAGEQHWRGQVDVHMIINLRTVGDWRRIIGKQRCIVHHPRHRHAKGRTGGRDQRRCGTSCCQILLDRHRQRPQRGRQRISRWMGLAVVDDDAQAITHQAACDRLPHAPRTAGDDDAPIPDRHKWSCAGVCTVIIALP